MIDSSGGELPDQQEGFVDPGKWVLPLVSMTLGLISMFWFDKIAGVYFLTDDWLDEFHELVDAAEHFGTPYGQLIGLFCLTSALHWKEWRIVRFFLAASCAGIAANIVKLFIARARPNSFDFETLRIWESFGQWLPFAEGGSAWQSFPSAHTASAFGFAAVLSSAYLHGKPMFVFMAILTGFHRISVSAHFPSDVFFGAAIGWLIGCSFVGNNWLSRKFDRLEQRRPDWLREMDRLRK
ncbi:PAP2 superfamily protein [Thalassoglobus neptunius]|uniref:PAP2 superfamily protein n=1 Tax=Thalassoglobus neptunius TaxID=1938619 RepID=A0A5C5VS98_9PLAN|nr:phosphatase PAP2 family protein [Thalassoglobus neptunius]TWT41484.1 PAP2 superfamily protein [Thalassoglobus neptunius]